MYLTDMHHLFRIIFTSPAGRLFGAYKTPQGKPSSAQMTMCFSLPLPHREKQRRRFFPVLTLLDEDPPGSIGVLYIAPLKALINDQFGRLYELCDEAGISVTRWHGDAPQSQKRKLLKKPSGILQITPESLESLMINKHMEIPSLFGDLRFIIIDEIHSLLRGDRGMQTFCLIERLCRLAECSPRRIGLSATIGNPEEAGRFLAAGSGRKTIIPRFDGGKGNMAIIHGTFL